jgi:tripartite-type tricarboxylate transporter receptor subunit TctC
MKMKRWRICWLVCGFTFLTFLGGTQAQEKYPNRPIELVVPMAPGGSNDTSARIYSDDLAKALKVPINVVNRAGGTGIIGATYVVKAKKDGYTLLQGSANSIITMPVISKEATYDPLKDFIPLGHFVSVPSVFAVRTDSPFKTLQELIEYARKNPGKLKNGAAGILSESQFNMEVLCTQEKIVIKTVPYNSGGEAMPALLGGHVDLSTVTLTTLAPQIKAGKLRGLAMTSKTRHPDLPDVPTTAEIGYPNIRFSTWFGIFAPAGVPNSVVDILVPTLEKIFKDPEVGQRAIRSGFTVDYKDPEELRKFVETQMQITEKVAREANLIKK